MNHRLPFIDFMRAVASLLILGHHLAFYGPLSEIAYPLAPQALDWLNEYARMAVQAFLVLGGFGMARKLSRIGWLGPREFGSELWARYRRTVLPYLIALTLAIISNELARTWMAHPSISAPPTWTQLLAHATLLTHILGFEALTAGAWYVAIDFQLLLLSLALMALAQRLSLILGEPRRERSERVFSLLSGFVAVSSLFVLNRLAHLDNYAVYFFCSYFLGMLVEWATRRSVPRWALWGYLALVALALTHQFRPRLLVAAATALLLSYAVDQGPLSEWPKNRLILGLGKISYSLFLVHFPVCLLVNAWGSRYLSGSPHSALFGMSAAVVLSVLAAVAFYHHVERRFAGARVARVRRSEAELESVALGS